MTVSRMLWAQAAVAGYAWLYAIATLPVVDSDANPKTVALGLWFAISLTAAYVRLACEADL